jgi:hypothetical protein
MRHIADHRPRTSQDASYGGRERFIAGITIGEEAHGFFMHMCGYVRLKLLPGEELLNGQVGGRPRPITPLSPPGMSGGVLRPANHKSCAVPGYVDLHRTGSGLVEGGFHTSVPGCRRDHG